MLYRDFQSADASRFGKFFGGCALTFLGVYLITSGRQRGGEDQYNHDMDDEEHGIGMIDEERYQDTVHEEDEDNRQRRKSSVNFAFETGPHSRDSRRPSEDRGNNSPRTPPPLLSHTSTTSSGFSDTESPLVGNPWQAYQERPRPLENTISSPLLPSEAQRSDPPSTPQSYTRDRAKAGRPSTLSRRSMARLTPGPLMSPLSSSLSAVVADNLRKGVDSPSGRRRPGPGLQQSRSQRATRSSTGDDAASSPSPSKTVQSTDEAMDVRSSTASGRRQSVGATLGEFFRLKRERSRGKATDRHPDDTQE